MKALLYYIFAPASPLLLDYALCFMRIGIGILTMLHGIPKIRGGVSMWSWLGSTMSHVGIYFLPVMWGFLAASAEFFGGIALVLGFGTRIASFALAFTMLIATLWHVKRGDDFKVYSFALSLMIIFISWTIIGGGPFSLDQYLVNAV